MKVQCPRCKERVDEREAHQHTLEQCKAAGRTYALIKHGLRPFPHGNSLPPWLQPLALRFESRGAWEGEPREERALLPEAEVQYWFPRWVDIIVDLWVGSIALEGVHRLAQRDAVLRYVMKETALQKKIVDAYREDLRAVRDLLAPYVVGELPTLLVEHRAKYGKGLA